MARVAEIGGWKRSFFCFKVSWCHGIFRVQHPTPHKALWRHGLRHPLEEGFLFWLLSCLLVAVLMGLWWSWRWWNANGTEVLHSLKYLRWKLQMDSWTDSKSWLDIIALFKCHISLKDAQKRCILNDWAQVTAKISCGFKSIPAVQVNTHPSPSEKLTAKRPLKIKQRLEDEQMSNFGGKQVEPIFRRGFPHELLVSGSVTPTSTTRKWLISLQMCRRRHVSVASPWNSKVEAGGTNHLGPRGWGWGDEGPSWSCVLAWQRIFHFVVSFIYYVFGKRSWRVVDWWKWWWWWWWWWIVLLVWICCVVSWVA